MYTRYLDNGVLHGVYAAMKDLVPKNEHAHVCWKIITADDIEKRGQWKREKLAQERNKKDGEYV